MRHQSVTVMRRGLGGDACVSGLFVAFLTISTLRAPVVFCSQLDVADNIDLNTVVQGYEDFYQSKYGRRPKLMRRLSGDFQVGCRACGKGRCVPGFTEVLADVLLPLQPRPLRNRNENWICILDTHIECMLSRFPVRLQGAELKLSIAQILTMPNNSIFNRLTSCRLVSLLASSADLFSLWMTV